MTGTWKPSMWGVAYCCFAVIMVTAFVSIAGGIDMTTLAMP